MSYSRLARHLTDPTARAKHAQAIWPNAIITVDPTAKTVETTNQPDPAWKKAVLAANGNRCSWVSAGERCPKTSADTDLEPRAYGSKRPEDCIALCPRHAKETE